MDAHWDPALFEEESFAMSSTACVAGLAPRDQQIEDASSKDQHRQKYFDAFSPEHFDHFAMVHTPIPLEKARLIEKAQKAIDDQWGLLEDKGAWNHDTVREKAEVIAEAKQNGKTHPSEGV